MHFILFRNFGRKIVNFDKVNEFTTLFILMCGVL